MGGLGLVFFLVVVGLAAFNERQTLFREAEEHAANVAYFLADHAQRLFEVSDIALRNTTIAIGTSDWDTLERSNKLWSTLHDDNALLPYVDDIWLNDATGRLRLTTFAFPAPNASVADEPVFRAVQEARDGLVIGERFVGKLTRKPTFLVARRLTDATSTFNGMIAVSLDLTYFTNYWRRLELPNSERVAVVRAADGDVLATSARNNDLDTREQRRAMGDFQVAIAAHPLSGGYQPLRKTYGYYHRIGDLPLYVTVEFTRADVVERWQSWLLRLSPLILAALVALLSIVVAGRRQARREADAAAELQTARTDLEMANASLERRVAERTADLRETSIEIQRFAYIVSHDLRAPLVNIMGFTSEIESLKPTLFGEATSVRPPQVEVDFDEAVGFIRSSIDKMDRLIRAILTLSREGQRNFRTEPIDLKMLVRSIADGVAHRTHTLGATIVIEDMPVLVSDPIAVEQIFSNLIDNAVKYLQPDRPGLITVAAQTSGSDVRIRVSDNGRGIDRADHERVFELFRRAGPQDQSGEGIGLAHVRALVRRLGGKVTLEGSLGDGCIFTVDLPLEPPKP